MGAGLQIPPHSSPVSRTSLNASGRFDLYFKVESDFESTQVTQPSVLVAFLPLTSSTSLDPAHVPLLRTALALLEVHPDRALGVAVTTEPALAR